MKFYQSPLFEQQHYQWRAILLIAFLSIQRQQKAKEEKEKERLGDVSCMNTFMIDNKFNLRYSLQTRYHYWLWTSFKNPQGQSQPTALTECSPTVRLECGTSFDDLAIEVGHNMQKNAEIMETYSLLNMQKNEPITRAGWWLLSPAFFMHVANLLWHLFLLSFVFFILNNWKCKKKYFMNSSSLLSWHTRKVRAFEPRWLNDW